MEQGRSNFKTGTALIAFCVIGFSFLFFLFGHSAGEKKTKKEHAFVVQKKLNNYKAEILAMDEGDKFVIENDEIIYLPNQAPAAETSLSDVKKM